MIIQARKESQNQVFSSTQQHKQIFLNSVKDTSSKLRRRGVDDSMATQFTDVLFNGLNLQIYNTPIDLFIEDFLHNKYERLQPFQFLSLYSLLQEGLSAVTNAIILESVPEKIVSITKTLNLVNALQFAELFGINIVSDFKASQSEIQLASKFYDEFSKIKKSRAPGQEFLLIKSWSQDLEIDHFFELENESTFETKSSVDDFLTKLQNDPFGLNEPEDPLHQSEMEKFKKHQESIGINMAIVMFMVDALQYFKSKTEEEIKATAYEIAMLGTMGIDPNKDNYILSSIAGKRFSGNQVLAYYYVSWSLSMPEVVGELGLDFKKEFQIAQKI